MTHHLLLLQKGVAMAAGKTPSLLSCGPKTMPTTTPILNRLIVGRSMSSNFGPPPPPPPKSGDGFRDGSGSSGGGDNRFKIPRAQRNTNEQRGRRGGQQEPTMRDWAEYDDLLPQKNPILRSHFVDIYPNDYEDDNDKKQQQQGEMMDKDLQDIVDDDEEDEDSVEFQQVQQTLAKLQKMKEEQAAQQERWLETAKTPIRHPVIDAAGRSYGRGRRKAASSRVWITPGFGHVTVNRQDFIDYFPRLAHRQHMLEPLVATNVCGQFDIQCRVEGGGLSGQAGAIRLGVARALVHWNPDLFRSTLKRGGFMTRDSRVVEPKKIGRVKARKRPQWNRR